MVWKADVRLEAGSPVEHDPLTAPRIFQILQHDLLQRGVPCATDLTLLQDPQWIECGIPARHMHRDARPMVAAPGPEAIQDAAQFRPIPPLGRPLLPVRALRGLRRSSRRRRRNGHSARIALQSGRSRTVFQCDRHSAADRIGGRRHIADRRGRKLVLVISIGAFGAFSLLTASMPNLSLLVGTRFLTGLGLGGAMPNLIAMAAETSAPGIRNRSVGIADIGMPIGGSLASVLAFFIPSESWPATIIPRGRLGTPAARTCADVFFA